jgi:hypothetical protein
MPAGRARKARNFTAHADRVELGIQGIGYCAAQR